MRRRCSVVILLAGLVSLAGASSSGQTAGNVIARAWVDSTNYLVGDWITVHVGFSHPAGVSFLPLARDTLDGFRVIERLPLRAINDTATAGGLIVSRYDSAGATLPGIPFRYSLPGDSTSRTVSTNPLFLMVHTVRVDTTHEIKDIKPPFSIPFTLAEIAVYVGVALLIGGLAYLLYRYWKKRQQKKAGVAYTAPPRPAHLVALEELAILKEKKLWQQGLVKAYYSEITEIIRRYIENRFTLMALEQTTDEIMDGLRGARFVPGDVLQQVETMLRRADLVKFAKHQPGTQEHEEMLTLAYAMVDRTKLVEMTPVTNIESKAPEHVGV